MINKIGSANITKKYQTVSVVIVNWNRFEDTCECIDSLLAQKGVSLKITCVDNGSSDNSGSRLRDKYDQIQLLQLNRNLGFAGGYNLGIKEALKQNTDYILIINNDTVADEWMVSKLLSEIQANNIGIDAPLIYYFENPSRIWSSGGYINKQLLIPLNSHHTNENLSHPVERTFISGCCYLMKKDLIEQVGLFDESFFLFKEN
jgi:GT2 family glycosyltransferase